MKERISDASKTHHMYDWWPEVMTLFSGTTQLRLKFIVLINVKNANNCWHFNIYLQVKLHVLGFEI